VVPAAPVADLLLVPGRTADDASAVFLVDPHAAGVTLKRGESTSGEPLSTVRLAGVRVAVDDMVGDARAGAEIVSWIVRRVTARLCAVQAGVCAEALRLTAAHAAEREQFGQRIATFPAVAQRAADAYIDTEAITLTARQAAWRLGADLDADEALDTRQVLGRRGRLPGRARRAASARRHRRRHRVPALPVLPVDARIELTLGGAALHLVQLGGRIAARASG